MLSFKQAFFSLFNIQCALFESVPYLLQAVRPQIFLLRCFRCFALIIFQVYEVLSRCGFVHPVFVSGPVRREQQI